MIYKVAELDGSLLDATVALAEGDALPDFWRDPDDGTCWEVAGKREWAPSSRWDQGGPIIGRERISVVEEYDGCWLAMMCPDLSSQYGAAVLDGDNKQTGPTHLIAAMRAYIASKFGSEVELP